MRPGIIDAQNLRSIPKVSHGLVHSCVLFTREVVDNGLGGRNYLEGCGCKVQESRDGAGGTFRLLAPA